MSHHKRATIATEPRSCGSVHVATAIYRELTESPGDATSPTSAASPGMIADLNRPGWPESMAVVASTGTAVGAIGDAAIVEGRLPDFYHHHSAVNNALTFGLRGNARIEWKRGGRLSRFVGGPGCFTITPAGEDNSFCMDRSMQMLNVVFGTDQLRALADREWKPYGSTIEILPVYHQNTPEIVALGQAFASQLRSPRSGSGLYAETLWTQIAIQLLWKFSSLPRQGEVWVERLPDARFRRVIDYLDASLASEISLRDLADVAGLSPNYFLSAFKKATGKTPHRLLTEMRIAKARELLSNPQMPIVNVALAVGFSSQSHLTTVFRRFMKTTPATYRATILGLGPEHDDRA
jgi:AraC family transcriptional regulator